MRNLEKYIKGKSFQNEKLLEYGFQEEEKKLTLNQNILGNEFQVKIVISEQEKYSQVIEIENDEEFILVDVIDATGEFVGTVRGEYEKILQDVVQKCTIKEAFKSKQAKEIIQYVTENYHDKLEFLWEKYDDNAIWRNQQNQKWYAALLTVKESKLGGKTDKIIEIIDLRYQKEESEKIVDGERVFPGYHMNKKSWITIKLDNSVPTEEIFHLIDNSYELSLGNQSGQKMDELSKKVYDYLTIIPQGKVVTYKQVAEYLGNKGLARIVGTILHNNPDGDKYPCYKVLNSKGELAEAFVFGGKEIQKERLEKDGIEVENNKVDLKVYQWKE